MKKILARNIAFVSALFVIVFSIMLITNYFQVKSSDLLKTEGLESLKLLNDENSDNPALKEQIRELDLLARKAYFISYGRLKAGVYILIGMAVVLVVSLRVFYAEVKNIPDKEIDPIDDWTIKTTARRYVQWIGGGLVVATLGFALLTSPLLKSINTAKSPPSSLADSQIQGGETGEAQHIDPSSAEDTVTASVAEGQNQLTAANDSLSGESKGEDGAAPAIEVSKVTHNSFRGNNSLGISSARNIPTSWNLATGANILWKAPNPRPGHNSPVINGNRVFLSGADEDDRELYCYELSSGKLFWKLSAKSISGAPAQMPKVSNDAGYAASTVTTNGKQVCAIFASGDLICADMDGKLLWGKNIGVPDNSYGFASSLLSYGNTLFIQYDNQNTRRVLALDMTTGAERWNKIRNEKHSSWTSPIMITVNNSPQLILIGNPGVTSYNPSNGEQNWRIECMSGEPAPSPAYANGIVVVATEYASMTAINAADGAKLWQNSEILPEISSPVATKDFVFTATSYGVVASFNPQTGEVIKDMELGLNFHSSPIIVEGKIYLFGDNGKVFIFSATGDFKLINSFDTNEATYASPAFTDKKIVVRTANSIYCVEAK